MPKDFEVPGARISLVQMEKKMYNVVTGAPNPERVLKNEVFRMRGALPAKELSKVLGGLYIRLDSNRQTAPLAGYMKDLYGIGPKRRLFAPKAKQPEKQESETKAIGIKRIVHEGAKLALSATSLHLLDPLSRNLIGETSVSMVFPPSRSNTTNKRPPKRKHSRRNLSDKGVSFVREPSKGNSPTSSNGDYGGNINEKLNLKSIAQYCLETAKLYEEVKPVYDMLMELLFLVDDPEWIQTKTAIKKRLEILETKATRYMTVNGDYVEDKHVENEVDHVEAHGIGIMTKPAAPVPKKDGRKRPTKTGKIVPDVYTYKYLNDKEGKRRITALYQGLLHLSWINGETNLGTFMQLFSGIPMDFYIKWTGAKADLYALIKNLCDKKLISCPAGSTRWVIARSHFVDGQNIAFSNLNKLKENKKTKATIDILLDLLNPSIPLKDYRGQ